MDRSSSAGSIRVTGTAEASQVNIWVVILNSECNERGREPLNVCDRARIVIHSLKHSELERRDLLVASDQRAVVAGNTKRV